MPFDPSLAKLVLAACDFVLTLGRSLARLFQSRVEPSPASGPARRFICVRVVDQRGRPVRVTLINETNSLYKTDCWGCANLPPSWAGHEVTVYDARRRELLRVLLPNPAVELVRIDVRR